MFEKNILIKNYEQIRMWNAKFTYMQFLPNVLNVKTDNIVNAKYEKKIFFFKLRKHLEK